MSTNAVPTVYGQNGDGAWVRLTSVIWGNLNGYAAPLLGETLEINPGIKGLTYCTPEVFKNTTGRDAPL